MAAFDFPASPTDGQVYTANGVTYVWSAADTAWKGQGSGGSGYLPLTGGTLSGPLTVQGMMKSDQLETIGNYVYAFMGVRSRNNTASLGNVADGGYVQLRPNSTGAGALQVDADGTVSIGGGVKFPASQVASADPNTIDDYEEGLFTPVIVGTTAAGVGTYTTQLGRYTKVGRIVHIALTIAWTAHTGTGTIYISGLPFTSNQLNPTIPIWANGLTFVNQLSAYIGTSSTNIVPITLSTGTNSASIPMDTAATLVVGGTYDVA